MKSLFIGFSFGFEKHSSNGKYEMFMKNGGAKNSIKLEGNKKKITI